MADENSNHRMGLFLIIFWLIFPIPLAFLGYGVESGLHLTDTQITIDLSTVVRTIENPSTNFLIELVNVVIVTVRYFLQIVIVIINIFLFIVSFLVLYLRVATLTFPGVWWVVARLLNLIQLASTYFVIQFLRRG